jgi:hypothetical protein
MKLATPAGWWLTILARLAIAGVFVAAAIPKMIDPAGFAENVSNYHLLPAEMVGYAAIGVPVVEMVVALALVAGVEAKGAALVAAGMLLVFTAGMGQAMARGIDVSCGCFGSSTTTEIGLGPIVRNVALMLGCAFVLLAPEARWRSVAPKPAPAARESKDGVRSA